ncbi:MAG: DUF1631 family protein [Pseudomonadota bacterium]
MALKKLSHDSKVTEKIDQYYRDIGRGIPFTELSSLLTKSAKRQEFANKKIWELSGNEVKVLVERLADENNVSLNWDWQDWHQLSFEIAKHWVKLLSKYFSLDERIDTILQPLCLLFWRLILKGRQDFIQPNNVYHDSIFLLLQSVKGIDEHSGGKAATLLEYTEHFIFQLCAVDGDEIEVLNIKNLFINHVNALTQDIKKFEMRVFHQEQVLEKSIKMRGQVIELLESKMDGLRLPLEVIDFLLETWSKYLYITSLREGKGSQEWEDGCRLADDLIWSVTENDSQALLEAYGSRISGMLSQIRLALASMHHNEKLTEAFFNQLEYLHLEIIHHGSWSCPSRVYNLEKNHDDATFNNPVFKILKQGDWVLVNENGKIIKGKVIGRDNHLGFLVITNFSGVKLCKKTQEELQNPVVAKTIEKMDTQEILHAALDEYYEYLMSAYQNILLAKAASAIKAPTERPKIPMFSAKSQQPLEKPESELKIRDYKIAFRLLSIDSREYSFGLREVNRLKVGARLTLRLAESLQLESRVGLIIQQTERFILLDDSGNRLVAISQHELISLIYAKKAIIKSYGMQWDDSIQSVVLESRKVINKE